MRGTHPQPPPDTEVSGLLERLEEVLVNREPVHGISILPALARLQGQIVARALAAGAERRDHDAPDPTPRLTIEEAATRLRKSESWLYHSRLSLHLGSRVGGRVLFSEAELDRFLASRAPTAPRLRPRKRGAA
jgi:hypothetical protein